MPTAVPREKYPEMDWWAANKVATWKVFKWPHEGHLHVADQVSPERQYALILMVGGDKAFNCWNTLEDHVLHPKEPEQVLDSIWEELQTINFILAFQRHLPSKIQQSQQLT